MADPSKEILERWRRVYRFNLRPVKRCATCRFVKCQGGCADEKTECTLLDIDIVDAMRSVCPGWEMEKRNA